VCQRWFQWDLNGFFFKLHGEVKKFHCSTHRKFALCIEFLLEFYLALLEGRNIITAPTIAAALPPQSSHMVLFVGAPVKVRDTSELTEFDALEP
jgi:hypothetical protein